MPTNMNRLTVARHRYTVGKSLGTALFAAFDPSTLVLGHRPFLGHLPSCKLAVVLLVRRCRSAVKCSQLSDCSLVFLRGPFHSSLFAWTSWLLYKESAQCLPEQLCPLASAHNSVIQSRASSVYAFT